MSRPVMIDTDMGVDDAVAVTLSLSTDELNLVGLVSVEGNVPLTQATANIRRLLAGLKHETAIPIGEGLSQSNEELAFATDVFAQDGLGGIDLPAPAEADVAPYMDLYTSLIDKYGQDLTIVAIGPLTNLASLIQHQPDLLQRVGHIVVMGGAIWCAGNVTPHAEFNFYRDPAAASAVLSAGLPLTVVPLDVTRQVVMDESHIAHLSRSNTLSGQLLAQMINWPLQRETPDAQAGQFVVHDALAVGILLWPRLFMRSRMGLEIIAEGQEAGKSKPRVAKDRSQQAGVVISVEVGEFLENTIESLCHERFIV